MDNLIAGAGTLMVGAFVGYLAGYMKEKGKNLATKEDFKSLTEQTAALTQTTKEIEARISDKVWDRQKQWEMKRDALFSAIQALDRADSELVNMATAFNASFDAGEDQAETWAVEKMEAMRLWREAANRFDDQRAIATLVCSPELSSALAQASSAIRAGGSKLFKNNATEYSEFGAEIASRTVTAHNLAREELGIAG